MAAKPTLVVDVRGVPEVIWACRHEIAKMLRKEADAEALPVTARRLREIAAMFEAGTTS